MARDADAGLLNIKQRLRRAKHLGDQDEVISVQIIGIFRYCLDPDFKPDTGLEPGEQTEAYDLLVTDGDCKLKCLLDPRQNLLVQQGRVLAGASILVQLVNCSLHYNETDLTAASFVILHSIAPEPATPLDIHPGNIPFSQEASDSEKDEAVPMATRRGCYLSSWCTEDPYGSVWKEKTQAGQVDVDLSTVTTIRRLAATWRLAPRPYQPLLVKILHKSRLRWYGRPNKYDKLPYQAYLEVADQSGHCTAVPWTSMCTELYNRIQEGDVLLISNYTIRERFQQMSRPNIRNSRLPGYDLEISLNKHHPVNNVTVVSWDNVRPEWQLPDQRFLFSTRKQLSSLPDDYNCDAVGVVTYVGRYKRERKGGIRNDTWLSRWIHLRDGTSSEPFRVKIYCTSQPEQHKQLQPGYLCLLTQLRVCHSTSQLQSSRQQRYPYLTTTNESQIYVDKDDLPGPYASEPIVKQLVAWLKTAEGKMVAETSGEVSGYYTYPPLPSNLQAFKDSYPLDKPLQITSLDTLGDIMGGLYLRETRQVVIQGFILRVAFVPLVANSDLVVNSDISDAPNLDKAGTTAARPNKLGRGAPQQKGGSPRKRQRRQTSDEDHDPPDPATSPQLPHQPQGQAQDFAVTVDDLWPDILGHVVTLGNQTPYPGFWRYGFKCDYRDEIQAALNMPANTGMKPHSQHIYTELPVEGSSGLFSVTILGLNQGTAIHAAFPAPQHISHNASLLSMLSGVATEEVPQRDMSLDYVRQLLRTGSTCQQLRMLFVLDVYNHGGQDVELVINRAYPVSTISSDQQ